MGPNSSISNTFKVFHKFSNAHGNSMFNVELAWSAGHSLQRHLFLALFMPDEGRIMSHMPAQFWLEIAVFQGPNYYILSKILN